MTPTTALDQPEVGVWTPIVRNATTRSGSAIGDARKGEHGRLIIVSNRLPLTVSSSTDGVSVEASIGGLVTALRKPHESTNGTWIGWPGEMQPGDENDDRLGRILAEGGMVPVHLTADEVRRYREFSAALELAAR